jgi:23S rRNA-/tRNA-specific pseudouridylate synthase
LLNFEPEVVGKKLLEAPKESLTAYEVLAREEMDGQPVSRVELTSISGRTHQLNVHCSALGHPIVGDKTYGYGGDAAPNGGLTNEELEELAPNPNRASEAVLKSIAVQGKPMCVHANYIGFRHPITKEYVSFRSDSPF